MAKLIRKLDTGEEVKGFELDTEIKLEFDFEGKALKDDEIEMIGSTGSVDRDGEVIAPYGWDLKSFKKNPVILASHNYSKPVIGKATKIRLSDGKLIFKIQFTNEGDNPEADIYRKLYKSGFMSASSIGFIPKEWEDGDGKKTPWRTYTKTELLELSLVSVPANSEALVVARSKGIINEEELELINKGVTPNEEEKEPETEEKEIEAVEKNADINYIVSTEHETVHTTLNEALAAMTLRLTFVEGFINGIGKSEEEVETKEVEETKSYIAGLLGGDGGESTEHSTDEKQSDVEEVKKLIEEL